MKIPLERLGSFAIPEPNRNSEQHKLGVSELAKYEGVYHYLYMIEHCKCNKTEASRIASEIVYKHKATIYKARKIKEYAKEYLLSGSITKNAQGAHSKRVSVLDDEDIKHQILEWFRNQPKAKRSIAALQKQLTEVILPKKIEADQLCDEIEVEGGSVPQLSADSIRRRLISWGFNFKYLGKLSNTKIILS